MNTIQHQRLHELNASDQMKKAQQYRMAKNLPGTAIRRERWMLMMVIVSFLIIMVVS